ncbi:MAG: hypothetical protein LBF63_06090 [Treponema sp.]|jgi:hypothetical protein|nr:hypothetical protein [Treponema sp.]
MKRHPRRKAAAPVLLLLFCLFPRLAAAQTRTEEVIDRGRFGAEEPEPPDAITGAEETGLFTHWLYLGLRTGPSFRFYTPAGDTPYTGGDTFAPSLDLAVQANVRLLSFLSVQGEIIFTWDNASCWAYYRRTPSETTRYTRDYTSFSLQIPLTVQADLYPGKFKVSPFFGFYLLAPLGDMQAADSLGSGEHSYSYAYSPPLGLLGGLNVAYKLGPGLLFGDFRYNADLGEARPDRGEIQQYRRSMVSFTLGYQWGFVTKKGKVHE